MTASNANEKHCNQSTSSLLNKSSGGTTSAAIGAVTTGGLSFCKVGSAVMSTQELDLSKRETCNYFILSGGDVGGLTKCVTISFSAM